MTATDSTPDWLHIGARALDQRTDRVGIVTSIGLRMGATQITQADTVWLRPIGGGKEWTQDIRHLAPADADTPSRGR